MYQGLRLLKVINNDADDVHDYQTKVRAGDMHDYQACCLTVTAIMRHVQEKWLMYASDIRRI